MMYLQSLLYNYVHVYIINYKLLLQSTMPQMKIDKIKPGSVKSMKLSSVINNKNRC